MKKILTLAPVIVASVVLIGPARAARQWVMLGEQTIKSVDPSVNINSEEGG